MYKFNDETSEVTTDRIMQTFGLSETQYKNLNPSKQLLLIEHYWHIQAKLARINNGLEQHDKEDIKGKILKLFKR